MATQFSVVRAPPVSTLVSSFQFITSFLWAPPVATQFSVLSQTFVKVRASCDPFVPFDFIASFLWAPPVATQFSAVRAPPVATLSCHSSPLHMYVHISINCVIIMISLIIIVKDRVPHPHHQWKQSLSSASHHF